MTMDKLARVLKALADKNRLRILFLLRTRKMCVCELAFVLGITQPSVSKHLRKLKNAGLVGQEQDGFWTNYFLLDCNKLLETVLLCIKSGEANKTVIKSDLEKLKKVNRTKICCGK